MLKRLTAVLALVPVFAQADSHIVDVPFLDLNGDYEVENFSDGRLVLSNDSGLFICETYQGDVGYVVEDCLPVLTELQSDAVGQSVRVTAEALNALPDFAVAAKLEDLMATYENCRISFVTLEAFFADWAAALEIEPGLAALPEVREALEEALEGGADLLEERGTLVVNNAAQHAQLTTCAG